MKMTKYLSVKLGDKSVRNRKMLNVKSNYYSCIIDRGDVKAAIDVSELASKSRVSDWCVIFSTLSYKCDFHNFEFLKGYFF